MNIKKFFLSLPLLSLAFVNMLILSSVLGDAARTGTGCPQKTINSRRQISRRDNPFNHMVEMFNVPITLNSLLEQQQRQIARSMQNYHHDHSVRYDITEDDEKMELVYDMPGVLSRDVSIELKQGGEALLIKGIRKYRRYGQNIQSEFDKVFTIDPNIVDIGKITANLSDGVLVVSAPKLKKRRDLHERKIPILTNSDGGEILKDQSNVDPIDAIVDMDADVDVDVDADTDAEKTGADTDGLMITEEEDI